MDVEDALLKQFGLPTNDIRSKELIIKQRQTKDYVLMVTRIFNLLLGYGFTNDAETIMQTV